MSETIVVSRLGARAAVVTLVGIVASGPLAVIGLAWSHPQPPWAGAELFAQRYHSVQLLPYFAGFLLVGGFAVMLASVHSLARSAHRARTSAALVFASAFTALVFFNYIVQTTIVPDLARHFRAENAPLLSLLTMSNPASLGWAVEMWAYALLGVATWLAAPVLSESALERMAGKLYVANGVLSIAGGFWTSARPGWVMTPPGYVMFILWNIVVILLAALTAVVLTRRAKVLSFGSA